MMQVSGTMPDVTPVQVVAFVQWIVSQAVAYGYLETRFSQVVLSAASTIVMFGWTAADAHIRNGRAKALAVKATAPEPPVTTVTT
jgi:hypothetical protein